MRITFLLFSLIFFINGNSQNVSRWKNALASSKISNEIKIDYADSLLLHYRKTNPDSALFYAHILKKIAIKIKDSSSIDYTNNHLGSLHRITGNFDSSVFYYYEALRSYQKRKFEEGVASVYNNLATVYKTQGRYDLAIKNYIEALDIFRNTKRYAARANLYSNFAGLYFKFENFEKAKYYWQLAEIDYKKEAAFDLSHVYRGFSKIKIIHKQYSDAENDVKKALELDIKNKIRVTQCDDYLILAEIDLLKKDFSSYENHLYFLDTLIPEINLSVNNSKYFELKGDYENSQHHYSKAVKYYDTSALSLKNERIPEILLRITKKRFQSKILSKDFIGIEKDFEQMSSLNEEVNQLRRDWVTQEMEARFSLKEQEEKIKILDEKNKVANELVQTERKLKYKIQQQILWMWIGIGLFVILIIYVLITNRKLQASQLELQKNIEQKEFLFKELNHRVKNNLHIVGSFLSIESFGKTEEVKEILLTCENRIQSLGLVHEMLYKGEISESIQLKSYLNKLTEVIKTTLIKDDSIIETNIPDNITLKSDKAVLLGLIANELITNSIKYAKKENQVLKIEINLHYENQNYEMIIRDNGVGMDESKSSHQSMGLKLAHGLSKQLKGTLEYQNNHGAEFKLKFSI